MRPCEGWERARKGNGQGQSGSGGVKKKVEEGKEINVFFF
jgi:hypothetical protein